MSDDFDFTDAAPSPIAATPVASKPVVSKFYDAAVAKRLFEISGKLDTIAAGTVLFVEGEKSGKQGLFGKRVDHRVYFVVEGEIELTRAGKPLDTISANEIFGEMAVISEIPGAIHGGTRSATATTKTACTLRSLDPKTLEIALTKIPEFGLMLMSVMFERLRFVAARLTARRGAQNADGNASIPVFDDETLTNLENKLERATLVRFDAERTIMREGDVGTSMYVVLSGRVGVFIKGNKVETNIKGCSFGEMALVDQSPRTASAIAETECELLALSRSSLISLIRNEPGVGMLILRSVADRLRYMNTLLG